MLVDVFYTGVIQVELWNIFLVSFCDRGGMSSPCELIGLMQSQRAKREFAGGQGGTNEAGMRTQGFPEQMACPHTRVLCCHEQFYS